MEYHACFHYVITEVWEIALVKGCFVFNKTSAPLVRVLCLQIKVHIKRIYRWQRGFEDWLGASLLLKELIAE